VATGICVIERHTKIGFAGVGCFDGPCVGLFVVGLLVTTAPLFLSDKASITFVLSFVYLQEQLRVQQWPQQYFNKRMSIYKFVVWFYVC
jgi:hypothetical protein